MRRSIHWHDYMSADLLRDEVPCIYVARTPVYPGWIKVGFTAGSLHKRLGGYNVMSPTKDWQIARLIVHRRARQLESHLVDALASCFGTFKGEMRLSGTPFRREWIPCSEDQPWRTSRVNGSTNRIQ